MRKHVGGLFGGRYALLKNTRNVPANLVIQSSATGKDGVVLSGGDGSYLRVYAPQTDVKLAGDGPIFGSLLGGTLSVPGGMSIHFDVH